jgi:hypothetical protein
VHAVIDVPQGHSSLDSILVLEPPILKPNFPSFGNADDQCPPLGEGSVFDEVACPGQAFVGSMSITSPLLPYSLNGRVYLIESGVLPSFGVVIDDPATGIYITLVGRTSTPKVDPNCNTNTQVCQTQIAVNFEGIPDLPVSSIDFNLDGPPRVGATGQNLSGQIVRLTSKGDTSCSPSAVASASFKPQSSTTRVVRTVTQAITGC